MTGSHIDSVPGGGHLDGALGVLAGLECLRRIKELNLEMKRPLESIAFSDEEGRFGGIFGSNAICGNLTTEDIQSAQDLNGVSLLEAMARHGLPALDALEAKRDAATIHAFVEIHIEQGPVLERQHIQLGAVDAIAGLFKWSIRLGGVAAHAGATPMTMRQDAFSGVAEFSTSINNVLEHHGSSRSVATIGRVVLSPGAANVIPNQAEFSLDVRDTDEETLNTLAIAMRETLVKIAQRCNLTFEYDVLSEIKPVQCNENIIQLIEDNANQLGITNHRMASGAAHDTQIMAGKTKAGLIFIPSKDGCSHSPHEWSEWEDIENGANILLNTLYQLANES
jgi:N-carbamoyl-L-amino-acid hydrolase